MFELARPFENHATRFLRECHDVPLRRLGGSCVGNKIRVHPLERVTNMGGNGSWFETEIFHVDVNGLGRGGPGENRDRQPGDRAKLTFIFAPLQRFRDLFSVLLVALKDL
jgi:hypothetical protein